MDLPDLKQLKKLALACRKAGIRQFKSGDFEFILAEDLPSKPIRKSKKVVQQQQQNTLEIESDGLTQEEKLFWSVIPHDTEPAKKDA